MAVEDDEMRLELLEDFGVSATYTDTSAASSSTVTVLFRSDFEVVDVGGGVSVESSAPVLHVRSSDVSSIAQGDTFVVDSTTYTVTSVEPDNEGMTVCRLRV